VTLEQQQYILDHTYWRDMKRELFRDDYQRNFKFEDERGEIRVNPKYLEAPYEEGLITEEGVVHVPLPYRFSNLNKCQDYQGNGTWSDMRKRNIEDYAVPFFILIKPDGTKEEVWE